MASKQNKSSNTSSDNAALKLVSTATDNELEMPPAPVYADGDMGKLQALLFGQQLNTANEQLSLMSQRFDKQLAESNAKWMAQTTELTQQFEHKLEVLTKELRQETITRREENLRADQVLESAHSNLQKQLSDAEKRTSQTDADRQNDLRAARSQWSSTLENTKEQLLEKISDATEELHARKVDRQALSGLLGTIASGLTNIEAASFDESTESKNASGTR